MSSPRRKFNDRLASRLVQVGFLAAVLLLWYLATTRWGVNKLLLPNPLKVWDQLADVIAKGEYLNDLRITLTELGVAFLISAGGRPAARLRDQPLALSDQGVRATVRRHLFYPDHPVPAALRAVLRARTRLQDCPLHPDQLLP